jgi:D-alanine transaminase
MPRKVTAADNAAITFKDAWAMWDSTCFLNGDYLKLQDAKVSVLDRGFIFGDGVYEVVPAYNRKPFCMPEHLARLKRSLAAIEIANPYKDDQWQAIIHKLIASSEAADQFVYFQVTRGVAKRDHAFPKDVAPTVFAMTTPFAPPAGELLTKGVSAITTIDNRWLRCEIKSVALLGNVLKRQEAVDAGAVEVVMFRDGMLTEGSASNIYIVKDGTLIAPPKGSTILEGIRYGLMGQLAQAAGVPMQVRPVSKDEVLAADECMLSSATKEVLAITTLDEKPVGHGAQAGKPGPVWQKLYLAYQAEKLKQCGVAGKL